MGYGKFNVGSDPVTDLRQWGGVGRDQFKVTHIKGTEESLLRGDSLVPLMYHDSSDLGLICLGKNCKIRFPGLSGLRIQSWILLKKFTRR